MNQLKFAVLVLIIPLLAYTGNGFFVVISLIVAGIVFGLKNPKFRLWWFLVSLVATAIIVQYILIANYEALNCGPTMEGTIAYYFKFIRGLVLNGLLISATGGIIKSLLFLALIISGCLFVIQNLVKENDERKLAPAIIICYVLFFIAATTFGRWCFGLPITESSRYIPHIAMGFLAFTLMPFRKVWLARLLKMLILVSYIYAIPKFYLWKQPAVRIHASQMQMWKECYTRTRDPLYCNQTLNFRPYPGNIKAIKLNDKLRRISDLNPSYRAD